MSKGSFKIYLVVENGPEHTTPIRAYTLKRDASFAASKLDAKYKIENAGSPMINLTSFTCIQIDLVTHDGAHALHEKRSQRRES